jgi:hypothetical protein
MYFPTDPGYRDTARMLVEAGLVLALEPQRTQVPLSRRHLHLLRLSSEITDPHTKTPHLFHHPPYSHHVSCDARQQPGGGVLTPASCMAVPLLEVGCTAAAHPSSLFSFCNWQRLQKSGCSWFIDHRLPE